VIEHLSLSNFKCFRDMSLPIAPLTLLAGLNGAGKSSVIQALLLLRQSWLASPSTPPLARLQLNGELVGLGTAQDTLYRDAEEPHIGFSVTFSGGESLTREFAYDREVNVLSLTGAPSDSPGDDFSKHSLFARADFQYLCAERLGPRASFDMSEMSVKWMRQLGIHGEFTTHFLSVYRDESIGIPALAHPDASSLQLKQQTETWLDFICPGTRLTLTDHPGMDVVQLQYQFVVGNQVTDLFRPTNVGFGLTYTLPIIVAVLAARPGSLLLLENPEAHLHPAGQARIGEFLARAANEGVQIILETHSDHVLNGIRVAVHDGILTPEKFRPHFFERRADRDVTTHEVVSPIIDRKGRLDQRPRGFFDQWDVSLRQLLGPVPVKDDGAT
jgi:predicted ATPase